MAHDHTIPLSCSFAGRPCIDPAPLREELLRHGYKEEAALVEKCNSILLARGRVPSRGYVVLTKEDFDAIPDPQDCRHSLILRADELVFIQRLCVTNVTAIAPRFEILRAPVQDPQRPGVETEVDVVPTTYIVVEIADARHYARMWSGLDQQFNLVEPTKDNFPSTWNDSETKHTYQEICEEVWKQLEPLFGFELGFHLSDQSEAIPPENIKGLALTAWDLLWVVLDLAGWTMFLDDEGRPHVFELGHEVDDEQLEIITEDATRQDLLDAGQIYEGPVPEKIKVTCIKRDYQFQPEQESTFTAGDHWRLHPTHTFEFESSDLIDLESEVAADTAAQLFSSVQLFISDKGIEENLQEAERHAKQIAIRYLSFVDTAADEEFEWLGLKLLRPSRLFAGVFFRSHERFTTTGLNSGVCEPVLEGPRPCLRLPWAGEEARPGLLSRDHFPHGREIYGTLKSLDPPATQSPGKQPSGVLPANQWGLVDVLKGLISEGGVSWTPSGTVSALNVTGGPVRFGRRVYVRWNYQLGTGGAWVIVASHSGDGDPTDWRAECLIDPVEVSRIQDPGQMVTDKRAMIKLALPPDADPQNPDRGAISFYNGPEMSVLASPPGHEPHPIVWTQCPIVKSLTATCFIKFGQLVEQPSPEPFVAGHVQAAAPKQNVTWLGPSRTSSVKILLPPQPERSDLFLVSGKTSSTHTELEWSGPGLSGYVQFISGMMVETMRFDFDRGILVSVTSGYPDAYPIPTMDEPPPRYGEPPEDCPCEVFNPCDPPPSCTFGFCESGTSWTKDYRFRMTVEVEERFLRRRSALLGQVFVSDYTAANAIHEMHPKDPSEDCPTWFVSDQFTLIEERFDEATGERISRTERDGTVQINWDGLTRFGVPEFQGMVELIIPTAILDAVISPRAAEMQWPVDCGEDIEIPFVMSQGAGLFQIGTVIWHAPEKIE